ncbi:MAG: CpaF family protein [Alphaproteobacteria bacterium]|jgi:pilus assembly protein CpaF|nr:CpaF family protein [Alphaproteobacteria bacterium]
MKAGDSHLGPSPTAIDGTLSVLADRIFPDLSKLFPENKVTSSPRNDINREIKGVALDYLKQQGIGLNLLDQRDLVSALTNRIIELYVKPEPKENPLPTAKSVERPEEPPEPPQAIKKAERPITTESRASVDQAKTKIQPLVLERIDTSAAAHMAREDLARDLKGIVNELLNETRIQLNAAERLELVEQLLNDMLGLGPLEPLLADEEISEVMVNGPKQVYCESKGKLTLTDIKFRDNAHVLAIATRIVTAIGRRIDESSPLCDARLADGSRVNIIIPPLAIDGPAITIRKFSKKKITLDTMVKFGSVSPQMARVLRIVGRCRLNILISGGTGSGKTTLLNALSQMIDHGERVVTIEDAAELQLQQPHVVRLETRPANLEGNGEITMRDLLKNALRMRPDRIIVGETRGGEAIDMLQAMNTGHDGSLSTVHANRPREAIMRLENMVGLGGANLSPRAIRQQIASAVDMIIQVSRMRDGSRRITHISEIIGMEGDVVAMQDLFTCEVTGELPDGRLTVEFKNTGLRPFCLPKAAYYGLEKELLEAMA